MSRVATLAIPSPADRNFGPDLVSDDRTSRNRQVDEGLRCRPGKRSRGGRSLGLAGKRACAVSYGTISGRLFGPDGRHVCQRRLAIHAHLAGRGAVGPGRRAIAVRPNGWLQSGGCCRRSESGNGSWNSTGSRVVAFGMSCTGEERPVPRSDGSESQASSGSVFEIAASPAFPAGRPEIRSERRALGEFRVRERLPQFGSRATGLERSCREFGAGRNGLAVRLPAVRKPPWIPARSCCRPDCVSATVWRGAGRDCHCEAARHGGTGPVRAEVRTWLRSFPISGSHGTTSISVCNHRNLRSKPVACGSPCERDIEPRQAGRI